MTKRTIAGTIGLLAFLTILVVGSAVSKNNQKQYIPYTQFMTYMHDDKVSEILLTNGAKMEVTLKDDKRHYVTDNPRNANFKELLLLNGVHVKEGNALSGQSVAQSCFSLVFIGALIFMFHRTTNKNKLAMSMGVSELAEDKKIGIDFNSIAGNEEAKESVSDIVDFIKNPEKYDKYGARMPKGVIFYGSPGTGKTLMAKAIAGEADVPF